MKDKALIRRIEGVWVVVRPRLGFGPVEVQAVPSQALGIKWLNDVAKARPPRPKG